MRIAVVVPVRRSGSGGFFKHLLFILSHYRASRRDVRYVLYSPRGVFGPAFLQENECHLVRSDDYRSGFREMVSAVNASDCDVVLNLVSRPLPGLMKPLVTIVQNIEPIQKAGYSMSLVWRLRLLILRREHLRACRSADMVIAVSEYLKECLMARFSLSDEKIAVVYHGVAQPQDVPKKPDFCIAEEFIFCAGSVVPYRGYEDVISALGELRREGRQVPQAVFAGATSRLSYGYKKKLEKLATRLGVSSRVVWAGALSSAEMEWCFRKCLVFVQSSRAEACPNIVLEALLYGCLSISCTQQPMPEIFDNAALYYPIGDSRSLADLIDRSVRGDLAPGKSSRADYIDKAGQRARKFDWASTGNLTLDALSLASKKYDANRISPKVAV